MKHRVWSLLAAVLLLAAACVFSVSAETTEPVCPHCNVALSQITWETWAGTAGELNATGHYRLAADYEQGGQVKLTGGDVVVDLAGYTLSTTTGRPFYVNGGTLTILDTEGGAVVTGQATASGSTLFVNTSGTLHIYGGTFESAATTGKDGGTVAVGGNMTLHDGTIEGSTSSTAGGCLQLNKGSFTMNGGTLTAGTASTSGGTIFAKAGTLNLNGGTIEAGTVGSGKSGKAVFAYTAATTAPCTVNIGSVSVPYAGRNSFVIGSNTTVNLSGAPKIGYLSTSSGLTIGEMTDGASIYLNAATAVTVTENANMADYLAKGYFKAFAAGKVLAMTSATTLEEQAYTCPCCNTAATWIAWNGTMEDGGHYYLSEDRNTSAINVPEGISITLDLHGKTLSNPNNSRAFLVYGNLTVVDTGVTGMVISGGASANGGVFSVQEDANVELYGGTYVGTAAPSKGSVAYVIGNMTIHEGVTLDGSAAQDTSKTCGTVYTKGNFVMDGGVILGAAAKRGGSIFVEAGSLTVTGGSICGGIAHETDGSGDDIYVLASTNVTVGSVNVADEFHINGATTINVSGAPKLGKLKLTDGVLLTLGQLSEGTNISVAANGAFTVANENAAAYVEAGYITLTNAAYVLQVTDNVLYATYIDPNGPKCPHCHQLMATINWQAFNAAAVKEQGGHYYLTGNVTRTMQLQILANVDSVIDLRGHNFTVTAEGKRAFLVSGILSIMDTVGEGVVTGLANSGNGGTIHVQAGATFRLYSGIITASNQTVNGGVIYTEGTLNILGGTVRGGQATLGGNIYAGSGAVVTINGGVIGGGYAVDGMGGNLYLAEGAKAEFVSGTIQNGKADTYGGNIVVAAGAELTVGEGYIRHGQANLGGTLKNFRGDNLYTEGTLTMQHGYIALTETDLPGNAILARGNAVLNIQGGGTYAAAMSGQVHLLSTCTLNADFGALTVNRYGRTSWYKTLEEAIAAFGSHEDDRCVRVLSACDITSDKDLYLDVNGYAVNVTLGEGAVLYGFDASATTEKAGTGSVTLLGEGTVARDAENSSVIGRYIALTKDGKTTFHKLEMAITKVTLRTDAAGFYYKAVYSCDPVLAAMVSSYGVVLSVNNMPGADFMTETGDINVYTVKTGFVSGEEVTSAGVFGILKDSLKAASNQRRGEMKIYANAYICFNFDGQQENILADNDNGGLTVNHEEFDGVAYSLYDILAQLDASFAELGEQEQTQVKAFYEKWYEKGLSGWYFENLSGFFAVGFGRADITPDFNMYISGGNVPNRISTEVLDNIYITCVAITDEEGNTALIISQDLLSADLGYSTRNKIAAETGVPFKNIMISATHTHSAPGTAGDHQGVAEYQKIYYAGALAAAKAALADRAPATAQTGSTLARTESGKQLVFVRRYKQLDGGYRGGVGNNVNSPLISHAYEANETMQVIKFVREGKKDILFTNLGAHATFNGATTQTGITSDFPGTIRDYVETNSNCLSIHFISGGADQNPSSELAWEDHGLDYKAYGQAVAKAALAATLSDVQTGSVAFKSTIVTVNSNKAEADAETLAKAEEANAVFLADGFAAGEAKAIELGFIGIYHARSILNHVDLEDTQDIGINALSIGELSFVFAPYEMFGSSAADIVANSPFENTFVVSCTNDAKGYVPTTAAYDMGCYESYTARVASGSAETLVEGFLKLLTTLAN